jgi:hypothetical protein
LALISSVVKVVPTVRKFSVSAAAGGGGAFENMIDAQLITEFLNVSKRDAAAC